MILTVTCNPALDVTYEVDGLVPGDVHRVAHVRQRPGGKGVNVARVLHQLGEPVHAVGLGDPDFAALLERRGVAATFVPAMAATRRTLVVRDEAGTTTSLWEPGPVVGPGDVADLEALVVSLLRDVRVLVVSGSLPVGAPADLPATLASLARKHGVPAILDLDGPALGAAVDRGGAIVTPNADELRHLLGEVDDVAGAAAALAARSGAPVVLTRGAEGLLVAVDGACLAAAPPRRLPGNPTGAGDATTAGIALGLAHGWSWPRLLPHAVALGAAAVVVPTAGEVDLATYHELVPLVGVTECTGPSPDPYASLRHPR